MLHREEINITMGVRGDRHPQGGGGAEKCAGLVCSPVASGMLFREGMLLQESKCAGSLSGSPASGGARLNA
jgi:hypothetical protein